MKITGELLKSERTNQNLSIQDAAFALKLSPKIITALEAGQLEALPAKTFIRGFVKSYAQFLKMDINQVLSQFQEEMGSTHPMPKGNLHIPVESASNQNLKTEESQKSKNQSFKQPKALSENKSSRSYVYFGVAVLLIILIVTTNRIVERYQKESIVEPLKSTNQIQVSQNSNSGDMTQVIKSENPSSSSSTNDSSKQSANPSNLTSSGAIKSDSESQDDVNEGFEPTSGKPTEIIIEAKKDIEIQYAQGNAKSFTKIKLNAKQLQVIRSTNGLKLKADDGGSFTLVVNGIDKGLAGSNNKPVKLSF